MKSEDIAIAISVTKPFDEGAGTTWNTTVPQTSSVDEINLVTDKMHAAMRRQSQWAKLERIEKELEHNSRQMSQLEYSMVSIEAKYNGNGTWPKEARSAHEQTKDNIVRHSTHIKGLLREKSELIASLGV